MKNQQYFNDLLQFQGKGQTFQSVIQNLHFQHKLDVLEECPADALYENKILSLRTSVLLFLHKHLCYVIHLPKGGFFKSYTNVLNFLDNVNIPQVLATELKLLYIQCKRHCLNSFFLYTSPVIEKFIIKPNSSLFKALQNTDNDLKKSYFRHEIVRFCSNHGLSTRNSIMFNNLKRLTFLD